MPLPLLYKVVRLVLYFRFDYLESIEGKNRSSKKGVNCHKTAFYSNKNEIFYAKLTDNVEKKSELDAANKFFH